jgi:ubiquinone/menaquinone biosynthesis C-methylase UbiE
VALAGGSHAGGRVGDSMIWLWIGLGFAGAVVLSSLVYWQLIVAEGTYLGPRVVAWTYDRVARRYDAIKRFDPQEESWFIAAPLLQRLGGVHQPLVLDVATGSGRLPLALLRNHYSGQLIGLDLSQRMLREARAKLLPYGDRVGLVWQEAGRLPFEDGVFDAVTCLEALEFLPHPLEALAEMVRVLAPGGVLFVTNRVGREARLLPGHTIRRTDLEQVLAVLGLHEVDVRRWQVSYDLAMARKGGQPRATGRCSSGWLSVLRCPGCCGVLKERPAVLSCPVCKQHYPIHEGIVHLVSPD